MNESSDQGFHLKYDIGDTLTNVDESSVMFRRDCIVVFTDPSFALLITKGIPNILFVTVTDQNIRMTKKGGGILLNEHTDMLRTVVKDWPNAEFLKQLPTYVNKQKKSEEMDSSDNVHMQITGFVSKPLAMAWRKFHALADLSKQFDDDMPKNIDTIIMEWMILSTINSIPYIQMMKNMIPHFKNMFEGDGNGV